MYELDPVSLVHSPGWSEYISTHKLKRALLVFVTVYPSFTPLITTPPILFTIFEPCIVVVMLFNLSHPRWKTSLPSPVMIWRVRGDGTLIDTILRQVPVQSRRSHNGQVC